MIEPLDEQRIADSEPQRYTRVIRNSDSYRVTSEHVCERIQDLVDQYPEADHPQRQRLIRDELDHHLRRYHQYSIQQPLGAHYQEITDEPTVFEHVVPASVVRDLVLQKALTAEQACNMPTCRLSRSLDQQLRAHGWVSRTPSVIDFWQRYRLCFDTEGRFETCTGDPVDTDSWDLHSHFEFVNSLVDTVRE